MDEASLRTQHGAAVGNCCCDPPTGLPTREVMGKFLLCGGPGPCRSLSIRAPFHQVPVCSPL